MNRRELLNKVIKGVKTKAQDPKVQEVARKKAKKVGLTTELEKVHEIKKPTQKIIEDMVDLGDKGDDIIKRREFLKKVGDRAFERNATHRAMDIGESVTDKIAKAVGKAGGVIKIAKDVGKKIRGRFAYMDDLAKF